ncbi:MAG: MBOAT family protein [Eubacterium sp.]|nr:MBOAT family protein [Eubacterium sp.]MCM1419773.1 MBOAT family protein [Roseburia sp.]
MVFSSLVFLLLFFTASILLYYLVPFRLKNAVILLSGIVFYAWGEPIYVVVMLLSTMIDYCAGLIMSRFEGRTLPRRVCLIVSIVMNLGLLGVFKYSGFIAENINLVAGRELIDPARMYFFGLDFLPMNLLPIGISFFTFQSMSYTIDLYRGKIAVQKNPITFAAFVTLYPQIVAGPIVRYEDVAAELDSRKIDLDLIYSGIVRFITGLGKKVLLANGIGQLWEAANAAAPGELSVLTAWLGVVGYTLQIYFDFSGYSDMAIGLGEMMGFHFPENFDYPYLSKSVSEFWRRWHMTLGQWFKSYVYFPLGGSKKGMGRTVFNLAVVWFLTGVWHGASWNFILWGTLYGVVIILEKLFLGRLLAKLPSAIGWLYTMLLVVLGWVLFASADLSSTFGYIGAMFGGSGVLCDDTALYLLLNYGILLVVGVFAATDAWKVMTERLGERMPTMVAYATPVLKLGVLLLCIAYLSDASYNPFLYFNF